MKTINNITVQYEMINDDVPTKEDFFTWVNLVLQEVDQTGALNIIIVDEAESQELNKTYRHKDKPTNVLSFPFEDFDTFTVEEPILGDLVLCAPVVLAEAKEQHKSALTHWAHLTIHGTLHLLGYDHIIDKEAAEMEALEIKLLGKLGYPNPYETAL